MRRSLRFWLLGGLAGCLALPLQALEVPLSYTRCPMQDDALHIASVKVADFDMLASPGKTPLGQIDLGSTDTARGLVRTTGAVLVERAQGREYRRERTMGFRIDAATSASSKGELFVLVDYLESTPTTGSLIQLAYQSRQNYAANFKRLCEPVALTNSGTWKRHQFRLPGVFFGSGPGDLACFTLEAKPGSQEAFFASGSQTLSLRPSVPPGQWKLPAQAGQSSSTPRGRVMIGHSADSRQPLYALVSLGEQQRLVILGHQSPTSSTYDRIYFDKNANGDLTDDPVIDGKAEAAAESVSASFPEFETTVQLGEQALTYRFRFGLNSFRSLVIIPGRPGPVTVPQIGLELRSAGYYRGAFEANGKRYQVALCDSNANGRFGDRLSANLAYRQADQSVPYMTGDNFTLTTDKQLTSNDTQILGDLLALGKEIYEVKPDAAAGKLVLTPATQALIPVKLPTRTQTLQLYTSDFLHGVMGFDLEGDQIRLPEGDYGLHSYSLLRKDKQGDLWRLKAQGTAQVTRVRAAEKDGAKLVYGEPFTATAAMNNFQRGNVARGNKEVRLQLYVQGASREIVQEVTHLSGTQTRHPLSAAKPTRPKEPSYRIATAEGEVVAEGRFEYG